MIKRETIITIAIVISIFVLGFLVRLDSIYLPGTPANEKAFLEDSNGLPYMFELDSYYHYRLTENFLNHGYLGDTKINDREWDLHSYYPPGVPMDYPPLIVYLTAFFYYLINLFAKIPLLTVGFWIGAFVAPISGIIAYFFARRFTNVYGALAAGIFIVTAPMYVIRTVPGWFDTDMFNIIFPLLVTWLFFEAVINRDNFRKGILIAFAAAVSMFLFALAWNGWQYTFYFIVLFSGLYIVWCKFRGREIKKITYVYLTFVLSSILLLGILTGFLNIVKLFGGPLELLKIYGSQNPWAPWPDVYITVSELGKPTLESVISGVGLAFFAGLLGFMWMFRVLIDKKLKNKFLNNMNWFFYLFLLIWTVVGFFALTKGARFTMMLIPPMAISAGIFIGISVEYLFMLKKNFITSTTYFFGYLVEYQYMLRNKQRFDILRRKKILNIIAILIIVWITVPSVLNVHQSISTLQPLANDDMWNASEWIHNYTSNDTVIISQWSYGHLFTAIADRPVVFDGRMGYIETLPSRSFDNAYPYGDKSPAIYREYWMDKAFTTDNETLSAGIFRMLSSSGDLAYLTVNNYTNNTATSVEILNNVLGVDKGTAREILLNNYHLNQEQTDNLLKYTHPDNPHPYVIVTTDGMLGIGNGLFQFGEWDFNKNLGMNHTYSYSNLNITGSILKTNDGLWMDTTTGALTWKNKTPYDIIIVANGQIEKRQVDQNSDFTVILLMDNKKSVVIDKRLENSLFTKLVIEKSNTTDFKSIFRTNTVLVWESGV